MRIIDIWDKKILNNGEVILGDGINISMFLAMKGAVFSDSLQQSLTYLSSFW